MGEKLGAMVVAVVVAVLVAAAAEGGPRHRNAYATMMYMGTPRDYEFYVATRVMLRSIARLAADADLVVIASVDVPRRWLHALYVSLFYFFLFDFTSHIPTYLTHTTLQQKD